MFPLQFDQFEEDEDDWLVHEDEEEGAPGAGQRRRRRRRRAGLEGLPGVDEDALEVRAELRWAHGAALSCAAPSCTHCSVRGMKDTGWWPTAMVQHGAWHPCLHLILQEAEAIFGDVDDLLAM